MNEQTKPRYFRLLEEGDGLKKEGDLCLWIAGNKVEMSETCEAGEPIDGKFLRPVQVDEWIAYSERKPTKEDFEPSAFVEGITQSGRSVNFQLGSYVNQSGQWCEDNIKYWRRITPPEQPKPKSVVLQKAGVGAPSKIAELILNSDGTAKLGCGDTISAESIDEFIREREKVMKKKELCF